MNIKPAAWKSIVISESVTLVDGGIDIILVQIRSNIVSITAASNFQCIIEIQPLMWLSTSGRRFYVMHSFQWPDFVIEMILDLKNWC